MSPEKIFLNYYQKLNPAQKEAVDTIDGPVMVIAGPGTGKTQILTLRIANILRQTDTAPEQILALTFTVSGVYSMRRRLVEIIGSAGYRVNITTFHSFCNDIIQNFPEEFPDIIGATQATVVDQIVILSEIIDRLSLSILKPYGDTFYYLKAALAEIARLKRENILPADWRKMIIQGRKEFEAVEDRFYIKGPFKGKMKGKYQDEDKALRKNEELVQIYDEYEKALRQNRLYDFSDMIIFAIKRLENNEDLLLQLQEEYQYILADEHQDANGSQNRLLELLTNFHDQPNLFIVGDTKQAIFQFQGASIDNFNYFMRLWPSAKKIALTHNYRSSQLILDSSHSLISQGTVTEVENLIQLSAGLEILDEKIKFYEFSQVEYEYRWLAQAIKQKLSTGVAPSEIAILYRNNKDVIPLLPFLEKAGIPTVIESDQDILADPEITKLTLLLRLSVYFGDEELLIKALHLDLWTLDPLDIYKLTATAAKSKRHVLDILEDKKELKNLALTSPERLKQLILLFKKWHRLGQNKNLIECLEVIIADANFLGHLLAQPDSLLKVEKLRAFWNEAKTLVENQRQFSLIDFVNYLDLLAEHQVSISSELIKTEGIRLMTAHKAKGLEFEYVFIVGARDGHWGNKRAKQLFKIPIRSVSLIGQNTIEDERRLFYVAITRAKKEVFISLANNNADGKHYLPSIFIGEIKADLIDKINTEKIEKELTDDYLDLFKPRVSPSFSLADKEFVNNLLHQRGLSVSALNNYLECPWRYFFVNLVRLPKNKSKHAMYGTAVHNCLKLFFDILNQQGKASKEELLTLFKETLSQESLSVNDFAESIKRGQLALGGYYDKYHLTWTGQVLTEFKIKGVEIGAGIFLTGNLDKIELIESSQEVKVVDYKTGQPKSRNQIEGKTKGANGNFKRQLVFYKLLLDRYDNGKYEMISGEIDFVEPDKKTGHYRREVFSISDKEVSVLESEIKQVLDDIMNLRFWSQYCSDPKCEYCAMRRQIN